MYLKSAKNIMVVYLLMKYDRYFVKYIIHCDLRKFRYKLYILLPHHVLIFLLHF